MPDITKCTNQECISADYCARFTCVPKPRNQSYAFFCGKEERWHKCEKYIGNEKAAVFDILAGTHVPNKFNSSPDFQSFGRWFRQKPYPVIKILDFSLVSQYAIRDNKVVIEEE